MSAIRQELVSAALERSRSLIDYKIHDNFHKQHEFKRKTILADKSLTKDEKTEAIRRLNKDYDRDKIDNNSGTKRICENCNQECLATLYCEYCVRNYLKANFSNWTSGNADIDNLIQECQMKTLEPERIVEWIPYSNLQNIKYLTKGGCSEIYTAIWINGCYFEWDSKEQQLKTFGSHIVVLKKLENVENANQSWLDEAKSHLTISNKHSVIVQCFGLTKDPSDENYMLVMDIMDIDLRNYLQQNHNQLTWKERINIVHDVAVALYFIHKENAIHRDLHSGNILYSQSRFDISDLGFCGPADKSLTSIYGNLPYIAPEVISRKEYTFKSDIYSVAMLMWEISSGKPPFNNYKHDLVLAMNIINGIRPKVVSGTPLEYKSLMEQCWDVDPLKRPDIQILVKKMNEINLHYKNISSDELTQPRVNDDSRTNYTSSKLFTSKVHQFENMPEPRNATEEEQEAFHSKPYDFDIPNNIEDLDKNFNESSEQNNNSTSKIIKVFNKLQINLKDDVNNDYNQETIQQQIENQYMDIDDENEIHNNPNLHSKEQNELEIPDDI